MVDLRILEYLQRMWQNPKDRIVLILGCTLGFLVNIAFLACVIMWSTPIKNYCGCVNGFCANNVCNCYAGWVGSKCESIIVDPVLEEWNTFNKISSALLFLCMVCFATLSVLFYTLSIRRPTSILATLLMTFALLTRALYYVIDPDEHKGLLTVNTQTFESSWFFFCVFSVYSLILYEWSAALSMKNELSTLEASVYFFNFFYWIATLIQIFGSLAVTNTTNLTYINLLLLVCAIIYLIISFGYTGHQMVKVIKQHFQQANPGLTAKITRLTITSCAILIITVVIVYPLMFIFFFSPVPQKYFAGDIGIAAVQFVLSAYLVFYYSSIYYHLRKESQSNEEIKQNSFSKSTTNLIVE